MNYFTLFGTYFIMWWVVFFIILPLKIVTHADQGVDVKGIHGSVPINPNLLYKILITTVLTLVLLLILIAMFYFDIMSIDSILGIA
ncbi:MAG: DUF1467 family protein [Rhizobiales bacterium]|jgi:predicted secreted protein|nr:DUF1467 family protein [Hyphomicrobiales bacterium]MBL6769964.1 DUF1467 family protein [Hyphomicrobiales bacterium]